MTRLRGRDLVMRRSAPKAGEDWFRIVNEADGDDVPDTVKVYIYDEIGYWGTSADDFVHQMMAITSPNIELHLNSPGGEIFDGVAIYNALKSHSASVSVYVDALAASAASFIAQAADEGKLFMARNATMMIHDGSGMVYGNAADMAAMADLLNKLSNNIADMYAQRAGGTVEDWRAMMLAETWYNSSEAVEAKLADSVTGETDEKTDKWDLSVFNHAGRKDAPSPREVRQQLINHAQEAAVTLPVTDSATPPVAAPPVAPPVPAPPVAPAAPVAVAPVAPITFKVNGQDLTDQAAVQNHINVLEGFRTDTLKNARKDFVASLAAGPQPKIAATQMTALEEFALSLSDEQYTAWQASWNAAPASSVLASHVAPGASNTEGQGTTTVTPRAQLEDAIAVAQAIVDTHKRAKMPQDKIEKTDSWKKLQQYTAQLAAL